MTSRIVHDPGGQLVQCLITVGRGTGHVIAASQPTEVRLAPRAGGPIDRGKGLKDLRAGFESLAAQRFWYWPSN
jgi:hypothetical protein